ncbi:hypothetical protein ETB97_002327 [Aspergillus alliaceus]|uniref:Uncharacterized protein n=1 Tax=Petromyces alliaceus TaxID=209559 RepID=A0A5N6GBM2_PETAA|nr:uncharacterized protein BDW43DRAFT_259491 [Aspergillus alliaceus]KAB8239861.1 hypothetical protein BDW43DRAFT_259491 [Aspergillus alliaceus]KAE8390607.1 hypothetical protein BDV23DRAFT_154918 [Aspergillus alliaceus]KAF5865814.1 hypothetical protein ETB97_002327 [Aspergillus burnettii]
MAGKMFGRSSGSVNAPIAAFSMALILTSYCISSIRTARREAQSPTTAMRQKSPSDKAGQESWVQQALNESREAERKKESK